MEGVHWADRLYGAWRAGPRFFAGGWGEVEREEERLQRLLHGRPPPLQVELGPPVRAGACTLRHGRFHSPDLPPAVCTGRFELLLPAPDAPVCLHLAATGEVGSARRRRIAGPLARAGIGALILENPWYGPRRPPGQRGCDLQTVADQLAMNGATIAEALGLLGWLRERGHRSLGVTGYSMGGSMAAYVGALSPAPLAVIPCATGISPAPIFTVGLLARQIDWAALGRSGRERLFCLLDRIALRHLPPPPQGSALRLVAAGRDGYVDRASVEALCAHWPGARLRWLEGEGHVSALALRHRAIAASIAEAFQAVSQQFTIGG